MGFGGYPAFPPLVAASLRGVPSALHEQNAVAGAANRVLAGVGALVSLASERGRATRPGMKLGVCGEHGGDPASIAFAQLAEEYRRAGQTDETLVGAGVGVELQVRRNFNLKLDWGFALQEINENPQAGGQFVSSGSNRVHISATIAF